jgi:UDP-N-acetylglucosamine diphosphorylase/glucosamine-1-phosphate N-acetyltransferase
MRICIYEDGRTDDLAPLTGTRPVSDLLCGLDSLGAKQARHFAAERVGYLVRPVLADVVRESRPDHPVNDALWLRCAPTVLVNARWLPPAPAAIRVAPATRQLFASGPSVAFCDDEIAYAVLDSRHLNSLIPAAIDDCLADLAQSLPRTEAGGRLIHRAWDLIDGNAEQLTADFTALGTPGDLGLHPEGFALLGPADRLFIHPTARIDPYVVADATKGPVWIGPDAVVTAFTRLEGPCAIGAGTQLFGAKIRAGTTLGPQCRIGGEVECSIVQGFTNKYHDGFLGHSYIGEWVNLAAGTITGDLRFDYQPVAMKVNGRIVETGSIKLGSVIGDHVRTGLGVLLDCGTCIGPFATVLPSGRLAPREIAAFARVGPDGAATADLEMALASAGLAMSRRNRTLTPALAALYRGLAGATPNTSAPAAPLELRRSA